MSQENVSLLFGKWSLIWKDIMCMGSMDARVWEGFVLERRTHAFVE
jgi:hypothetical protein